MAAIYRVIPVGDLQLTDVDPVTLKRTFVMITGAQYARQKIQTRLKFFLGEWFLDLREGVPMYRDVFVQNPDLEIVKALFRKVILSVQEVASVPKLDLTHDRAERSLAIEFDATLVAGGVVRVRQPDPPFLFDLLTSR